MMISLQFPFAALLIFSSLSASASASAKHDAAAFLSCLTQRNPSTAAIVYTPSNSSFLTALNFLIMNGRFINPETPKPQAILRPIDESQIQAAIFCGKKHDFQMRVRSGGHDFEGSSYISQLPFFIVDMFNFQNLSVDSKAKTAWIGVGLSHGQVYYGISQVNSSLGSTGSFWPTVGVGGHISSGGYGPLVRQYGLAADSVLDARVIDVNGRILDRKSMGEDLFWAIRGGVGSDFAIITAFKMRLYEVPPTVAVYHVNRTLEQNAIQLIYKWQQIARSLPLELTLSVQIRCVVSPFTGNLTAQAEFITAHRGSANQLLSIMNKSFPELGLTRGDIQVMTWIEACPFLIDQRYDSLENILTNRSYFPKVPFKWKVDFTQNPIPPQGLQKIFDALFEVPPQSTQLGWTVFGGGVMDKISPSKIPFPHRGKLLIMREPVFWNMDDTPEVAESRIRWVRHLHDIIRPYVSNHPRAQYANYRAFDLGVNKLHSETSVRQASKYGVPYFGINIKRLVRVKSLVDPEDYLKSEQSLPPQPLHFHYPSNQNNLISGVAAEWSSVLLFRNDTRNDTIEEGCPRS